MFLFRSPPVQRTVPYHVQLNDQVYDLTATDSPATHAEVVFFHGLPLDEEDADNTFWRTWTETDTDNFWPATMLPAYLEGRKRKDGLGFNPRVLAVTYDSRRKLPSEVGTEGTNQYLLSENLVQNLILDPRGVGQRDNVPVILVGHDLGGILIKQFILFVEAKAESLDEGGEKNKLNMFLMNLKTVFFYSTPHNGSPAIETLMNKIGADNKNEMLMFMTVLGKEMSRVNAAFTDYRSDPLKKLKEPRFKTFAVNAAFPTKKGIFEKKTMVCPEGTARVDIDNFYTVNADHYQVCQAKSTTSNSMTGLANNIVDVVEKIRTIEEEEKERFERLKQFEKNVSESSATESSEIGVTIP